MSVYDVIIIGGGFLGLSTAYQLARSGVRTLLLEAGDIGSGTSGSCSGRAQVCEGHLDALNITLIREGLKRHATLSEELGADYEWRKVGLFLLLRNQRLWDEWIERSAILTAEGIPTEVVDCKSLQNAEPHMHTGSFLGAAYSVEGMLNPLKFVHAYAQAAARCGATIRRNSPVIGMQVENHRITAVRTATETFYADRVAVMAGAWESAVTRLAGVEVPLDAAHAETFITECIPPMIFNNIGVADSYEIIHGKAKAATIGIHPELNGSLDIAESVVQTKELHHGVGSWGISAMAGKLVKLYPFLEKVRVVRCWGRPTSFSPDEEPLVGWAPQLDNLYLATSLVETITTVPLLSEWMALMLQDQEPPLSLERYSPARFAVS
jgi:sarcosine oxidase, subunit beta